MTHTLTPFHLAIPVNNLDDARHFYGALLGCTEGRSDSGWIDYNFYGHQLVCHRVDDYIAPQFYNPVDEHSVPVPHFGVVMEMSAWQQLAERLKQASIGFVLEPYVRFAGKSGEQGTFFLFDPSGNALEFKGFKNISTELFKK